MKDETKMQQKIEIRGSDEELDQRAEYAKQGGGGGGGGGHYRGGGGGGFSGFY